MCQPTELSYQARLHHTSMSFSTHNVNLYDSKSCLQQDLNAKRTQKHNSYAMLKIIFSTLFDPEW